MKVFLSLILGLLLGTGGTAAVYTYLIPAEVEVKKEVVTETVTLPATSFDVVTSDIKDLFSDIASSIGRMPMTTLKATDILDISGDENRLLYGYSYSDIITEEDATDTYLTYMKEQGFEHSYLADSPVESLQSFTKDTIYCSYHENGEESSIRIKLACADTATATSDATALLLSEVKGSLPFDAEVSAIMPTSFQWYEQNSEGNYTQGLKHGHSFSVETLNVVDSGALEKFFPDILQFEFNTNNIADGLTVARTAYENETTVCTLDQKVVALDTFGMGDEPEYGTSYTVTCGAK